MERTSLFRKEVILNRKIRIYGEPIRLPIWRFKISLLLLLIVIVFLVIAYYRVKISNNIIGIGFVYSDYYLENVELDFDVELLSIYVNKGDSVSIDSALALVEYQLINSKNFAHRPQEYIRLMNSRKDILASLKDLDDSERVNKSYDLFTDEAIDFIPSLERDVLEKRLKQTNKKIEQLLQTNEKIIYSNLNGVVVKTVPEELGNKIPARESIIQIRSKNKMLRVKAFIQPNDFEAFNRDPNIMIRMQPAEGDPINLHGIISDSSPFPDYQRFPSGNISAIPLYELVIDVFDNKGDASSNSSSVESMLARYINKPMVFHLQLGEKNVAQIISGKGS